MSTGAPGPLPPPSAVTVDASRSRRAGVVVGGLVLVLTLAVGLILIGAQWPSGGLPHDPVGQAAPALALPTLQGEDVVLSELADGPVLLAFWASWCTTCKSDMPLLRRLDRAWADRGVRVVGVVIEDRRDAAIATAAEYDHPYPSLFDADAAAKLAYGVTGTPHTFLIGRDGTIAATWIGPLPEHDVEFQLAIATQ